MSDHKQAAARAATTAATFIIQRTRARHGCRWDQGPRPVPPPYPADQEPFRLLATRRLRGLPECVVHGLLAWSVGQRPVDLLQEIPAATQVLARQATGRRCVSLLEDEAAAAHGDPRHPDGLSFALHDLCHLEKFVAPADHRGQVGFFACVARALDDPRMRAVEATFDQQWRDDRDYVIADMNGSAVFLFAALKMKLRMAVRRRRARALGVPAPQLGPLDAAELADLQPVIATLTTALGLPAPVAAAAHQVSARRDSPADARRLLAFFEAVGDDVLGPS